MSAYQVGDKVQHRPSFLRAIGWYVDVPMWGTVVQVTPVTRTRSLLTVEWETRYGGEGAPPKILCANVTRWGE